MGPHCGFPVLEKEIKGIMWGTIIRITEKPFNKAWDTNEHWKSSFHTGLIAACLLLLSNLLQEFEYIYLKKLFSNPEWPLWARAARRALILHHKSSCSICLHIISITLRLCSLLLYPPNDFELTFSKAQKWNAHKRKRKQNPQEPLLTLCSKHFKASTIKVYKH